MNRTLAVLLLLIPPLLLPLETPPTPPLLLLLPLKLVTFRILNKAVNSSAVSALFATTAGVEDNLRLAKLAALAATEEEVEDEVDEEVFADECCVVVLLLPLAPLPFALLLLGNDGGNKVDSTVQEPLRMHTAKR